MFIVKSIITKPAGTQFRARQVVPGTTKTMAQWAKDQPGVLGVRNRRLNKNKIVKTVRFADQAAMDAFLAALDANPEHQARQEYNAANGITVVTRKFQVVE